MSAKSDALSCLKDIEDVFEKFAVGADTGYRPLSNKRACAVQSVPLSKEQASAAMSGGVYVPLTYATTPLDGCVEVQATPAIASELITLLESRSIRYKKDEMTQGMTTLYVSP